MKITVSMFFEVSDARNYMPCVKWLVNECERKPKDVNGLAFVLPVKPFYITQHKNR